MPRPAATALVALLLVLAGCGSTAGPSTTATTTAPSTDATPTPTPTTAGPDVALSSVPGVTADGVDTARLTEAHGDRLNETSYRLNTTVRRGPNRIAITVVTAAGPEPTRIRTVRGNRTREEYYDGKYYARLVTPDNVTYDVANYVGRADFSGASVVREYMSLARYEPTGTTRVEGTPAVVLSAGPDDIRDDAFGDATTTDFSSRAVVDRNGVVRSFRFVAVGRTADGRRFVVRVRLRVTGLGETEVATPDWLPAARDAAANGSTGAVDSRPV